MSGKVTPLLRSFAGGEITPEMFGRLDLDKFQTGLARALNFRLLPHGPAQNRAGFQYVLQALQATTSRAFLIPFEWSADQTMMLGFTDGKVVFLTNAQVLLEAAQALDAPFMTQADPGVFTITGHGLADEEWLFCWDADEEFALHGRFMIVDSATADTFTLTDLRGNAIDTTDIDVPTASVSFERVYTVDTPYTSDQLFDLHFTQSADVLTITHPSHETMELRRVSTTSWTLTAAVFEPAIATPAIPTGSTVAGTGTAVPIDHKYVTTAISGDNFEESYASPELTLSNDLLLPGSSNKITPAAVADAARYNIYKEGRGGLFGFIGQSDGTEFMDDFIEPDMTLSPPEPATPFSGADNYPATVTYQDQRRCFAGTNNKQQTLWMTRSATEGNLSQSIPTRDNDAIIVGIKARQQNRIRHLVPLVDLIAFTIGSEWRIRAVGSEVLTPSTVKPELQSSVGASNVQPVSAEAGILYASAKGSHIREFAFTGSGLNGATYSNTDISILAPHLFDGYSIVDMTFSRTASCPTVFCVRSDGVLLAMTYVPSQNVRAWYWMTTDGYFESAKCISEGDEDVLYAVIRRTVDGVDYRYYERQHTRQFTDKADAFFVDSGLTYDGEPTAVIGGLWHLEGKSVVALADGGLVRNLEVTDGRVTLPQAASKVHLGLQYTATLRTLPLSWQADGFGQGMMKNVNQAHLRLSNSSGVHIGPTDGELEEVKQRTDEPYDSAPDLINGWEHVTISPQWQDDGSVELEQPDPLPVTVLAMVFDVVASG
jgi:hypothetical protein